MSRARISRGARIKIAGSHYDSAISAQPRDGKKPAIAWFDLSSVHAAQFKCVLGGDFPVGDESESRKIVAERSIGKEANFLTVIEPFEDKRMIKTAAADGPDAVRVELSDGRVQDIAIHNFNGDGRDISIEIKETAGAKPIRSETASASQPATMP